MKTFEHFKNKEIRLKLALSKCDKKLKEFKTFADSVKVWTDYERQIVCRWNDWHDLKERIEYRLLQNYLDFQHQNFLMHGFAAY
jgi:hypothetical protein